MRASPPSIILAPKIPRSPQAPEDSGAGAIFGEHVVPSSKPSPSDAIPQVPRIPNLAEQSGSLPADIIRNIMMYSNPKELVRLAQTNKENNALAQDMARRQCRKFKIPHLDTSESSFHPDWIKTYQQLYKMKESIATMHQQGRSEFYVDSENITDDNKFMSLYYFNQDIAIRFLYRNQQLVGEYFSKYGDLIMDQLFIGKNNAAKVFRFNELLQEDHEYALRKANILNFFNTRRTKELFTQILPLICLYPDLARTLAINLMGIFNQDTSPFIIDIGKFLIKSHPQHIREILLYGRDFPTRNYQSAAIVLGCLLARSNPILAKEVRTQLQLRESRVTPAVVDSITAALRVFSCCNIERPIGPFS